MSQKIKYDWVDISRALTILCVIVGHTIKNTPHGPYIFYVIFSFHMPFFFIISGFCSSWSTNKLSILARIKHNFHHLLVPSFIIIAINRSFYLYNHRPITVSFHSVLSEALTYIMSSGRNGSFFGIHYYSVSYVWFFSSFFISKLLFDCLHCKLRNHPIVLFSVCSLFSVFGYYIKGHPLPLCIDIAFVTLPLFFLGNYLKRYDFTQSALPKLCLYFITWIIHSSYLFTIPEYNIPTDFAGRSYPQFPFFFIPAILGTMSIIFFAVILSKTRFLSSFLCTIGGNSFILYFIHCIDSNYDFLWAQDNGYIRAFQRVAIDLFIFFIVLLIKKIISIFRQQKREAN